MTAPLFKTALIALSATAAFATAANAGTVEDGKVWKTTEVRYADLNLTTDEGADRLATRVRGAARIVCGVADARDIVRSNEVRACRSEAIAKAQPAIELAVANARSGREYADSGIAMSAPGR